VGSGPLASCMSNATRNGGEWSSADIGRFTTRETAIGVHQIGRWAVPLPDLGSLEERKTSCLQLESNQNFSVVQPEPKQTTNPFRFRKRVMHENK
jgi:hypothetical protein